MICRIGPVENIEQPRRDIDDHKIYEDAQDVLFAQEDEKDDRDKHNGIKGDRHRGTDEESLSLLLLSIFSPFSGIWTMFSISMLYFLVISSFN